MREVCAASFKLGESNQEEGTFKGLASVFNTLIDAYVPTVIAPGAFTKTLQENASRVRILYQHDDRRPIGKPVSMTETQTGLEVVGKISDTIDGRDARTLMRDGVITDLSIGFDPMKEEFISKDEAAGNPIARELPSWPGWDNGMKLRVVKEVRLWEFSPVTWGANKPARIQEIYAALRGAQPPQSQDTNDIVRQILTRVVDGDGEAAGLIGPLSAFIEQHAGKVLSGKNLQLAKSAQSACGAASEALMNLIAAAEPPPDPDNEPEDEAALTAIETNRANFLRAQMQLAELTERIAA